MRRVHNVTVDCIVLTFQRACCFQVFAEYKQKLRIRPHSDRIQDGAQAQGFGDGADKKDN